MRLPDQRAARGLEVIPMQITRRRFLQAAIAAPVALGLPNMVRANSWGDAGHRIVVGAPWTPGLPAKDSFRIIVPPIQMLQARHLHSAASMTLDRNEGLAAICANQPRHFAGLASLSGIPEQAAREMEHAVALGLKGGVLHTGSPDDQSTTRFDAAAAETAETLALPLYLHPAPAAGGLSRMRLRLLGLIHGGLLDRHPQLNLIIAGGMDLADWVARLARIEESGVLTGMERLRQGKRLERRFTEYLRAQVHFTSAGMTGRESLHSAVAAVGPGRVMLGEDNHPWLDGLRSGRDEQLLRGNALRVFKL